jgi:copper chaperone CopZ
MKMQKFQIKDMHCANCAMRLQSLEDDLPGVERVDASYRKQQILVQYDETRVSSEEIIQSIAVLGYTAVVDPS